MTGRYIAPESFVVVGLPSGRIVVEAARVPVVGEAMAFEIDDTHSVYTVASVVWEVATLPDQWVAHAKVTLA